MKQLVCLVLLCTATVAFGQHTNFNTQRNWSLNKKEILFGGGITQFLGDLGGRNRVGTDYSLADVDWPSSGWSAMAAYRYRWHPYWATTTEVNVGLLRGNDAHTMEIIRRSRNLHFRSMVIELKQRIEIIILANEKFGARYNIPGLKGMRNHNEQIYLFSGAGIAYFNPKALYQGSWTALRPLGTEGQGLADGPRKYLPVTATVPFGIGLRMGINRMWRVGIEATYVKTFSDYIDDVSGSYYDRNELAAQNGAASAYLSNPSVQNTAWFSTNQQRGDNEKDAYYYINVVFARNVTYKDYARARRMHKWKGIYKF